MGVYVPVILMPSSLARESLDDSFTPRGHYSASFRSSDENTKNRIYRVLDDALFSRENTQDVLVFAVLNIADEATDVLLPENGHCLAIELFPHKPLDGWEIPEGVQFERRKHHFTFDIVSHNDSSFRIPKDELKHHGITFRRMYL